MEFLKAIWRWITFADLRGARKVDRARNKMFTSSVEGVEDAFDIEHDNLVKEATEKIKVLGKVKSVIISQKDSFKALEEKQKEKETYRNGAIHELDAAEADRDKAQAVFERVEGAAKDQAKKVLEAAQARVDETTKDAEDYIEEIEAIEKEKTELQATIANEESQIAPLEKQVEEIQRKIAKLPEEKAKAAAQFKINQQIIETNKEILSLQKKTEASPVQGVKEYLKDQKGEVLVTSDLAKTVNTDRDAKYKQAGQKDAAADKLDKFRAARKAEREAKGQTTDQQTTKDTGERQRLS
jgi:phage shock protein A